MNDHPSFWQQFAIIAGSVPVFCGLFYGLMAVRWRKMACLYPDGPFTAEHVYYSVSGNFGWRASKGYSHHLAVGKQGLRLFAILPLRWVCPPILIPWEAIYVLQGKPSPFGSDSLFIEISGVPSALGFWFLWRHGKAISLIQQYWEEHRVDPSKRANLQSKSSPVVLNRA